MIMQMEMEKMKNVTKLRSVVSIVQRPHIVYFCVSTIVLVSI